MIARCSTPAVTCAQPSLIRHDCGRFLTTAAADATEQAPRIITYPTPSLRQACVAISDPSSPATRACIDQLLHQAVVTDCMGLAAPQIGAPVRAFVMRKPLYFNEEEARRAVLTPRRRSGVKRRSSSSSVPAEFIACVNPRIVSASEEAAVGIESCLSVPDHIALVRRSLSLSVEYVDGRTGSLEARKLSGLPAVVFAHELDHLDGVLLLDREMRVFVTKSEEEELAAAHERWMLQLMKYYGVPPHPPASPPPDTEG